jgi:glyoxylase-like metal-dependent hydrolase (beta-lactamase superfamily II)
MKLYTINTGYFKLDGGAMFGVVPKQLWNKLVPADENNLCTWAMRCLLVQDEDRLILIDTGIGNKQEDKFFAHYHLHGEDTLQRSLAAHGFTKDDITDVLLTHLHFDHVGGAVEKIGDALVPAFKNATYWSNQPHWQWATQPNDREKASFLKENILPLQQSGQLQWITADNESASMLQAVNPVAVPFSKNIQVLFANGHTNAMMLPVIQYRGKTIVYMADLLPSVAHIPLPYVMGYDMFPLTTLQEKKMFLTAALERGYVLYFEHDAANECCTLQQTDKGIRHKNTFSLDALI